MTDNVREALELRLGAMSPALATAWENKEYRPVATTPYQRVNLLWASPDNRVLGCDRRFEQGILQVTLRYPVNKGTALIEDRAALILEQFKRGTDLSSGGQTVRVMKTPVRQVLGSDGVHFGIAISINFQAEVFS